MHIDIIIIINNQIQPIKPVQLKFKWLYLLYVNFQLRIDLVLTLMSKKFKILLPLLIEPQSDKYCIVLEYAFEG